MSGSSTRVAVIIPTVNRRASLKDCLDSVLGQSRASDEIIVIDNASTDGTAEMIGAEYAGRVTLVRKEENVGCTGGFAEGIRFAHAKGFGWFWLLDDDNVAEPDALARLLKEAAGNPRALYGPRVLDPQTRNAVWQPSAPGRLLGVPSIAWGGLLLSREIVESVGLPMHELWVYGCDVEYCLRAKKRGFPSYAVHESVVYHPAPEFVRWGRIGKRSLILYPRFRSPDRAFYYLRNWTFVLKRYWTPWSTLPLVHISRDMLCLLLSRMVPVRTSVRAIRDGFRMRGCSE